MSKRFFKNGYFQKPDFVTIGRHPECRCEKIRLFVCHPLLKKGVGYVCDCEKTVLDFDLKYGEKTVRKKYY